MRAYLRPAIAMLLVFTVITGVVYPLAMLVFAQLVFPTRANGSLVHRGGVALGSELIGQKFESARYFHGRPSSAGDGYDAASSGGSNLGPLNPMLLRRVDSLAGVLRAENSALPVPVDLVTTSGSGLDPHISPAAAEFQVGRVARARGLSDSVVRRVVSSIIEERTLGILGEPRVNVLRLNLALDALPTH